MLGPSIRIERIFRRIAASLAAAMLAIGAASIASASSAETYRLLNPETLSGDLKVLSLENSNSVTVGSLELTLDRYEPGTIPAVELTPGAQIAGTRTFAIGGEQNATDLIVPEAFAGTEFVIPHFRGSHKYFFLSPSGNAQVTIKLGANTYNVNALEGLVNEFDAGSDNSIAGRLTSDFPILVAHVGYAASVAQDAYPVPPAANNLWGIRSQTVLVGALEDNTSISAYASDAATGAYLLNGGEYVSVTVGASTSNGQGAALHLVSDGPIAAIQIDDSDGNDATGFWQAGYLAVRHGIPVDAQYVAVVCAEPDTSVTLYEAGEVADIRMCQGSSTAPGKLYFGAATSGVHIDAGSYVESDEPIYLIYEAAASEDEHNLLGYPSPLVPVAPSLDSIVSSTNDNPVAVTGSGPANTEIRLYVNGELQESVFSAGDGSFSFDAVLVDGINAISTTSWDGAVESAPSSVLSVEYVNNLSREQNGTIIGTVVWTPGTPAQAYTVTAGDLIIDAGSELILQPGTEVRFGSGYKLVVNGTLVVTGSATSGVTFTSNLASPSRGSWPGIVVGSTATEVVIEHALIEWAENGVYINGVSATVLDSTIRNFSSNGIYVYGSGASGSLIEGNTIDNLNDQGSCILTYSSSPAIEGNLLTNCGNGIYVYLASSPTVTNGNDITSNIYGLRVYGQGNDPQPLVTGNRIHANSSYNYYTNYFSTNGWTLTLNARGNWWGSTDPAAISAKIYDLTDDYDYSRLPTVDYSDFLDGPAGAPVPGNYLIGPLPQTSTSLTPGATYDVLGSVFVSAGQDLTVPAGTVLRFRVGGTRLVVDGALTIQGAYENRAKLTSGQSVPARGDWYGIQVRNSATSVLIDHAIIEWSQYGVVVSNADVQITNSVLQNFSSAAIHMTNATAASEISNNYIDNYDQTGYGIYLSSSSPLIADNRIHRTAYGIYMVGASNATVTGNTITHNGRGIYLDGNGSNNASAVPNPTVTGNDIFGNTYAQIEVYDYGSSNPVVINATGNWWGTDSPMAGDHIKFSGGSPGSSLDFSSPATGPLTPPIAGNASLSEHYFSPNGDAIKEATSVSGTLTQTADWTIAIRAPGGAVVRTYSGSGTSIAAIWDGQDASSQFVPDGAYGVEITVSGSAGPVVIGYLPATVDTVAPATTITIPAASATLTGVVTVPVTGSAADLHLVNYLLEYGQGSTPSTWTTINTQSTGVNEGLLGTWVVSSIDGTIALPNGSYVLRLGTSDLAGNAASIEIPVTLDNLSITDVTPNLQVIHPLAGEQLQIDFSLTGPATATLEIYEESDGTLVNEISEEFTSGGAKSLAWDGRTSAGAYVPDEAYKYVILATDGLRSATYSLPDPTGGGGGSGAVDSSFNAARNDFWKMNYSMGHFGRVQMQVSGCTSPTHFPYDWVPFPPGTHPLIWDGRGADGQLVTGTCSIYFPPPQLMNAASVIVRGTVPTITGTGQSPNIEVMSDPYRVTHSYNQLSHITYRLDQDAFVTVKLLPPSVTDPSSPEAILVVDNVLKSAESGGQPMDHVVEWKGYDELDTNDILVSEEGVHTFVIQATSVQSGASSLYRGALQVSQ